MRTSSKASIGHSDALKIDVRTRTKKILSLLNQEYPEAKCSLAFKNAFELLVATILSAQCTDDRVNKVTPLLFENYPDPHSMANAELKHIESLIKSTGFFRSKARSLREASQQIMVGHGGHVPKTMEELTSLSGVGRKTANVLLGNVFGIPGMVVDTHVKRLSQRMGLTKNDNPEKIELELEKLFSRKNWVQLTHLLISHGRQICTARKAHCGQCVLAKYCPQIIS